MPNPVDGTTPVANPGKIPAPQPAARTSMPASDTSSKAAVRNIYDYTIVPAFAVFGPAAGIPASASANGVPWPLRGYVPWSSKAADSYDPWSFSMPDADFGGTGVSMANDQGQLLAIGNVNLLVSSYGDSTLSRILAAGKSQRSPSPADTRFNVPVNNVMVGDQAENFQYGVTFFIRSESRQRC